MKKFLLLLTLALVCNSCNGKAFDSVFEKFRNVENAEYVKLPSLLVRLGVSSIMKDKDLSELPLNIKITEMRVLDMEDCKKSSRIALQEAVKKASASCELLMEATDEGDAVSIWVEPKNEAEYSKLIIYSREDSALIEFSGKFKPRQ